MDEGNGGSGVGEDDVHIRRAELVLVSLSNLKSKLDEISLSDSRPSSCPAYTFTDYFYLSTIALIKLYMILT